MGKINGKNSSRTKAAYQTPLNIISRRNKSIFVALTLLLGAQQTRRGQKMLKVIKITLTTHLFFLQPLILQQLCVYQNTV